jgi:hypothetical protein
MSVFVYTSLFVFIASLAWMIAMFVLIKRDDDDREATIKAHEKLFMQMRRIVPSSDPTFANKQKELEEHEVKMVMLKKRIVDRKQYRLYAIICTVISFIMFGVAVVLGMNKSLNSASSSASIASA